MAVFQLTNDFIFPHPELGNEDGLLAVGGDLSVKRLLLAYRYGIFPWYSWETPVLWWSPDPRMVLFPDEFKVSKSLRNKLNQNKFEIRFDISFEEVIRNCAKVPRNEQGETWITEEMIKAYLELHKQGYCHCVETWHREELVGGLYGVSLGRAFFGESMFYKMSDASKVALYYLVEKTKEWSFHFIDAQQQTIHLQSLGAKPIARKKFLSLLDEAMKYPTKKGKWRF